MNRRNFLTNLIGIPLIPYIIKDDFSFSKRKKIYCKLIGNNKKELPYCNGYNGEKLINGDKVVWEASGGTIGPINEYIIYNEKGSFFGKMEYPPVLLDGETFTVKIDSSFKLI